jgi:hypothetical protein
VLHLAGLSHARSGSRALSTYKQAVLVLRLLPHAAAAAAGSAEIMFW